MSDDGDDPHHSLRRLLQEAGYTHHPAWVRLGTGPTSAADEAIPRGKNATAKAKQRARDRTNGWAECSAKAPDDEDARRLIAEIGRAIKDPRMRRAIRLTLGDPRAALIGSRMLARRGPRWWLAAKILIGWR